MAGATAKRIFGSLLFLIALVVFLSFIFLLFADSQNISDVPFVDQVSDSAKVVGIVLGAVALLLAIIILVRAGRKRDDEEMFFIPEKDRIQLAYSADDWPEDYNDQPGDGIEVQVYHLPSVPRQKAAWEKSKKRGLWNYHFPRAVEHALYVNDYVTIDHQGSQVLMRTLIAGPENAHKAPMKEPRPYYLDKLKKEHEAKQAEEDAKAAADAAALAGPGDGEEFMEKLEAAKDAPADNGMEAREEVYYGYKDDNASVDTIEGIGSDNLAALKAHGVHTVARLCYEDPNRLATSLRVAPAEVSQWQATAELVKVTGIGAQYAQVLARAGIDGISGLKRRTPAAIATDVNAVIETAGGTKVTERRVAGWQEAAKLMRRTKQRVPAN